MLIVFEVALEILIPLLMAALVDGGLYRVDKFQLQGVISHLPYSNNLQFVLWVGGLMVLASLLSLLCGALAARTSAVASMGFAKNLRERIFRKILQFSFKNTDKFRTASLVMRATTDVNNMQNTYQQIIRIMVRAPIMMVLAAIMAFRINVELSFIFIVAIPLTLGPMILMVMIGHKRFRKIRCHEPRIGRRFEHSFRMRFHGSDHFRIDGEDPFCGIDGIEKWLLVFLQIAVVGHGEPFADREHCHQVAVHPAGFSARDFGDIRILLLRHEARSGAERIGKFNKGKFLRHPENDILGKS